jgi:AcrR family transcriptional regulator
MIEDAHILERALALFTRYGIRRTSLEAVAEAAGTTRVTLYRRFSDKETLLNASLLYAVRRFEEDLRDIVPPDGDGRRGRLEDSLEDFARVFAEGPVGTVGNLRNELARVYPEIYREILEAQQSVGRGFFRRIVDAAGEIYRVRSDADPELLYAVFETLLRHMPESTAFRNTDSDPGELFSRTARLLLFGIFEKI